MRDMRAAVCLAQEVGAMLGGSALLLGRLSGDGEAKGIGMSGEQRIFERAVRIARAAEEVFLWHERPGAFARLTPPWERVEMVSHVGGIRDGARVTLRTYLGPAWRTWEIEHRDYVAGRQFRDVLLSGPFSSWDHLHRIEPDGVEACVLTDTIRYRLPLGGDLAASFVEGMLDRMFDYRHRITREDMERAGDWKDWEGKRVVVSGASGLVGAALAARLTTMGVGVVKLVRRAARAADEIAWDPAAGRIDWGTHARADAIVHLAGENIAEGRWTAARKEAIKRSRIDGTATLARGLAAMGEADRPRVLVSASATGWYGDTGERAAREGDAAGGGFLARVCEAWEAATQPAEAEGVRVVKLRTGVVLTTAGGALAKILPAFRAGLGGRLGSGEQWMSWITLEDLVEVIGWALRDERVRGPVNAVAPEAVQNMEFTATLGGVLGRPTVVPAPAVMLRLAFGQIADEALLASSRVVPAALVAAGFEFRQATLEQALRAVLGKRS